MVLLIPAAVRKIKAQGRKEGIELGEVRGRKEGLKEGRTSERQRITNALSQLGVHEGSGEDVMLSKADLLKILHADADTNAESRS